MKAQLSRRTFLAQAATAVVLSAAHTHKAWAAEEEKVGLQLYTVGTALTEDPAGTLKKVKAIGFEEVEVAGFAKLTPKALRGLIDDAGLQCPAAHLQFGFEETGKVLEQANDLRVSYAASSILLPGAPVAGGIAAVLGQLNKLTADDFKKIAERANQIGEQAKKAGVQFAYHNHTHEFRDLGGGKTGYEILLAETEPALVQFEADCGWMITAGAHPVEYFRRVPERFRMIHIKDFPASTKVTTEMGGPNMPHPTQLGQGHIDYKPVIAAARRAGVKHFFVEQDPPMVGLTALEAAAIDYKYVRSVF
ncbi:sugar phosphate isomerase/epimerase family protein [Terriglobus saanensis]|uniref:Xylose isomerase domain-containing protein TIM barrel n=1 Tax=Terriglobus saanensis (strain ATCC BAA-1853 / DSM 23119 / SP1PR4) TaxID=401053 RepID=E8UYA0_TERSS|nr:sugar phosphate isomerase/epimerase [Terriglobus saanensis]ADV80910.1 Xylose isomerase domain-containing protein TIM barrel [Terriglobus saanensis SP1PR4]